VRLPQSAAVVHGSPAFGSAGVDGAAQALPGPLTFF